MIKQIRLSLLTAVLSLFLAGFAFAQEDSIKPFGGIEWEDGLLEEQREEQRGQIYLSIASKSLGLIIFVLWNEPNTRMSSSPVIR